MTDDTSKLYSVSFWLNSKSHFTVKIVTVTQNYEQNINVKKEVSSSVVIFFISSQKAVLRHLHPSQIEISCSLGARKLET